MSNTISIVGGQPGASLASTSRMSVTRALIWKQCNDLTQSFTMLSATGWGLLLLGVWLYRNQLNESGWTLFIALLFTCAFALVSCFVSFVTEAEQGTREFLAGLPVSSFKVGLVKLLVSAAAVTVFFALQMAMVFVAIWLQSFFTTGDGLLLWIEGIEDLKNSWYYVPIFVAFVFVSCLICCSFWSSSWMAVATAIPLIILSFFVMNILLMGTETAEPNGEPYFGMLFAATCMIAAVVLPLIWLRRRPLWQLLAGSHIRNEHAEDNFFWSSLPAKLGIATPAVLAMPGRGRFSALCWQSLRQQMMLPQMAIAGLGVMIWLYCLVIYGSKGTVVATAHLQEPMQMGLIFVVTCIGFGFGWGALYRDKLNSNLCFFQQHQEHGRELLFARVLFPIFLLFATSVAGVGIIYLMSGQEATIWLPLLLGIGAFSATLMWSMAFRSHVYALAIGSVLALTLQAFVVSPWGLRYEFGYPWMAALPFVWLATCFACAPAWLAGRMSAAWMTWFTLVSVAAYSVPLWIMIRWLIGMEPGA